MKMKSILGLILLLGIFFAARSLVSTQNKKADQKQTTTAPVNSDEVIAQIKKYREEGDQKLANNKFTRKEVRLAGDTNKETIRQKWEKLDAYYDGTTLVRLQLYYLRTATSERTSEFYLRDNKLVFALIQDKGSKHEAKELYFHNDKLIKFEDQGGEQSANAEQEKKMYESRLPLEISKLVEILKKH